MYVDRLPIVIPTHLRSRSLRGSLGLVHACGYRLSLAYLSTYVVIDYIHTCMRTYNLKKKAIIRLLGNKGDLPGIVFAYAMLCHPTRNQSGWMEPPCGRSRGPSTTYILTYMPTNEALTLAVRHI